MSTTGRATAPLPLALSNDVENDAGGPTREAVLRAPHAQDKGYLCVRIGSAGREGGGGGGEGGGVGAGDRIGQLWLPLLTLAIGAAVGGGGTPRDSSSAAGVGGGRRLGEPPAVSAPVDNVTVRAFGFSSVGGGARKGGVGRGSRKEEEPWSHRICR